MKVEKVLLFLENPFYLRVIEKYKKTQSGKKQVQMLQSVAVNTDIRLDFVNYITLTFTNNIFL